MFVVALDLFKRKRHIMQQDEEIIHITTNNTPGDVNSRIISIIFAFIIKYESAID